MKRLLALSLAATLPFFVCSPAVSRSVVIDAGEFIDQGSLAPGCTIGAPCTATTMPFSLNLGTGLTDQVFIYDRGIVSFGAPLPDTVNASTDFTTLDIPVIAPLYVPGDSGVAGPYEVSAQTIDAGSFFFPTTDPILGSDVFLINFLDPSTFDPNTSLSALVSLIISASSDQIRFEFIHGMTNAPLNAEAFPNTSGAELGYVLVGQSLRDTTPDIARTNSFTISLNDTGVPEPATWLAMLVGFGMMGLVLRRGRRERLPARVRLASRPR